MQAGHRHPHGPSRSAEKRCRWHHPGRSCPRSPDRRPALPTSAGKERAICSFRCRAQRAGQYRKGTRSGLSISSAPRRLPVGEDPPGIEGIALLPAHGVEPVPTRHCPARVPGRRVRATTHLHEHRPQHRSVLRREAISTDAPYRVAAGQSVTTAVNVCALPLICRAEAGCSPDRGPSTGTRLPVQNSSAGPAAYVPSPSRRADPGPDTDTRSPAAAAIAPAAAKRRAGWPLRQGAAKEGQLTHLALPLLFQIGPAQGHQLLPAGGFHLRHPVSLPGHRFSKTLRTSRAFQKFSSRSAWGLKGALLHGAWASSSSVYPFFRHMD